jgi:hypothetical protein
MSLRMLIRKQEYDEADHSVCIVCVVSISPLPRIILRLYWKYRNSRSSSLAWTLKNIVHNSNVIVMWLNSCVISNIKWAAVTCFRLCSTKNLLRSSNVYNYFGEIYVYSNKLYESVTLRKKWINEFTIQMSDDNYLLDNHRVLYFSESMPGYWVHLRFVVWFVLSDLY